MHRVGELQRGPVCEQHAEHKPQPYLRVLHGGNQLLADRKRSELHPLHKLRSWNVSKHRLRSRERRCMHRMHRRYHLFSDDQRGRLHGLLHLRRGNVPNGSLRGERERGLSTLPGGHILGRRSHVLYDVPCRHLRCCGRGIMHQLPCWHNVHGWRRELHPVSCGNGQRERSDFGQLQLSHHLQPVSGRSILWGGFWLLLLFAFLNSVIAVCLATANVGTRMWYAMARSGSFPKALAKVEPKRKTPTNAILLQMVLSLVAGIGVGFWFGADVSFFLIDGLILVIGVTVVYLFANLSVFMFYRGEKKAEFNVLLHVVFPLLSSLVLIYAVVQSFNPAPAEPYSWAPVIDGVWFLAGVVILVWMRARGREDWLLNAGEAIAEA